VHLLFRLGFNCCLRCFMKFCFCLLVFSLIALAVLVSVVTVHFFLSALFLLYFTGSLYAFVCVWEHAVFLCVIGCFSHPQYYFLPFFVVMCYVASCAPSLLSPNQVTDYLIIIC